MRQTAQPTQVARQKSGEPPVVDEEIFEPFRIRKADIRSAYGLVTLAHPDVSLADWRRFARHHVEATRRDAGIMALRDGRGCIHALFTFRVARQMLGQGPALQVTELAALRLPGTVLIDAVLRFAGDLAHELKLPSIALDLQPSATSGQDRGAFERRGFSVARVLLRGRTKEGGETAAR
jgi:hypothetical protein